MRKPRGILSRVFAATMLVWLGLVITEPLPLDACPMHGSHAMHGVAQAAHASHHSPATHGGAPKKGSNQCTCIGDCSVGGASFAAMPAGAAGAPELSVTALVAPPHASALVRRAGLREHTLPPSNGPPRIS